MTKECGITCAVEIHSRHRLFSSMVWYLGLVVIVGLCQVSCDSGPDEASATGAAVPLALVVDQTRLSDPNTGLVLTNDFARIFYPRDTEIVTRIGRDVPPGNPTQRRAFMSATIFYMPPLTVEQTVHFVGGDPNPTRDMVAMRCRPLDFSTVEPILATWPNVFNAVFTDLGSSYTPADCPSMPADPVDRQIYCNTLAFVDQAQTLVPVSLANAFNTGATTFQLTGAPFKPTGSTTGADVLFDLYGIGLGFSGTGLAVKDSSRTGQVIALTATQALEQSVVPEYLLKNLTLAEANCRCIRVKPYPLRDQSALNWDAVWRAGNQDQCTKLDTLP